MANLKVRLCRVVVDVFVCGYGCLIFLIKKHVRLVVRGLHCSEYYLMEFLFSPPRPICNHTRFVFRTLYWGTRISVYSINNVSCMSHAHRTGRSRWASPMVYKSCRFVDKCIFNWNGKVIFFLLVCALFWFISWQNPYTLAITNLRFINPLKFAIPVSMVSWLFVFSMNGPRIYNSLWIDIFSCKCLCCVDGRGGVFLIVLTL